MKIKSIFTLCVLTSFIFLSGTINAQHIEKKYQELGGPNGMLGKVVEPQDGKGAKGAKGGMYQHYEHGHIYYHPDVGAFVIYGDIFDKWEELKWEQGFLGYPRSDELWTPDHSGRFQLFQGGNIYWKNGLGAFEVHGKILGKYGEHKYEQGFLGFPRSDELWTPDRSGKFQLFEGGNIYWKNNIGAFEVHGKILGKYGEYKYEQGFLGYPMTDEVDPGDGRGRFQNFEGGQIYWTPQTGAHEVHGAIFDKWGESQWEKGPLGYPVTDELKTSDGVGRYNDFEGGKIVWNPKDGAVVHPKN